ncbi:MAG: polysaccharide biosynthesis/export family protein [Phycisphaerales bacterium]|nr:polysaccharide biosynthesis/export family protein [Phycisphaerales bacterium]
MASTSEFRAVRHVGVILAACGLATGSLVMTGCEVDSFIDPSTIGRWEKTPTTVPILERLSSIEEDTGEFVEYSDATAQDLIPEPSDYRLNPGDQVRITAFDDVRTNAAASEYDREVDIRGRINMPQIGQVELTGLTLDQARDLITERLKKFVNDPLVEVVIIQKRQQTFTVVGAVQQPGPYFIPKPDYRLYEAITAAGQFNETIEYIYVVRQVPLSDLIKGNMARPAVAPSPRPSTQPDTTPETQPAPAENLIDLIDELSKPKDGEKPKDPASGGGSPGMVRPAGRQPVIEPPEHTDAKPQEPAIDLVDSGLTSPASVAPADHGEGASSWVFLEGRWVQVKPTVAAAEVAAQGGELTADQLMTQRVVRIPLKALLDGSAQYNVVIRPGDIIRIPTAPVGVFYMEGQVQRPGPYSIPDVGRMTLTRAVVSAGGLSTLAVPERVDLTRMVGKDRQATIRLDLRAVKEGTMPDIYLKRDDVINVGTNFWAYPLAVVRNGFRATYGFGFVLDRNFADDVFGPQ